MVSITVKEVESVSFHMARELLSLNEPILDFATRYPYVLESCLATPFLTITGGNPYPGLLGKAAIMFYLMIKNHPFQNGNKRIAVTTLTVFLYRNGKWLKADTQELFNFTVWVAESLPQVKNETVKAVETFLRTHLVDR